MNKSILKATLEKEIFGNLLIGPKDNLQEAFTLLGEELTRQKAIKQKAQGLEENLKAATEGGKEAGGFLKILEDKGVKVI